jgi:FixJ family two-component response regulator
MAQKLRVATFYDLPGIPPKSPEPPEGIISISDPQPPPEQKTLRQPPLKRMPSPGEPPYTGREIAGIVAATAISLASLKADDPLILVLTLTVSWGAFMWIFWIGSADEFLSRPRPAVPSCLILDLSLPGLSGLDLQKRIAGERTDMPIIFITGHGDIPSTVQAMKAGAVEFLTKPFTDEALLSAIRQALECSRVALVHDGELRGIRDRYASLSLRERQVMELVVSGMLNKQVGGELGISEITVKAHRGRVMQKMNADSLAELVEMAGRLRMARTQKAS